MRRPAHPRRTLVCVHDRKVDRTSSGTGIVSEMTLDSLTALDYGSTSEPAELLTLSDLITLALDFARPVKLFIETKHPVRFGGLVEAKLLAELHRFGIASPPSADHSRAVVMSFSASAVWRVRRSAPLLPTVLLGDASRYLGGGASTAVGATAIGPSIKALREHPDLVDRAAAAGRATYCWTVDDKADVDLCRELGSVGLPPTIPGARSNGWAACRFCPRGQEEQKKQWTEAGQRTRREAGGTPSRA